MKQFYLFFLLGLIPSLLAANNGEDVAIVYNRNMSESKMLARYYAGKRNVPASQIFGLDVPAGETMTRADYRNKLEQPLLKKLEEKKLLVFRAEIKPAATNSPGTIIARVASARIRYLVLCYGVPSKISQDDTLVEPNPEHATQLWRNEAAVDSELSLLPAAKQSYRLNSYIQNPVFDTTNSASIDPRNGVIMVARLDGPTVEVARGLVDKAMQAEKEGLWGRAYIDSMGNTNGRLYLGDAWMRASAGICRKHGYETYLDEKPEMLARSFPLSQVAFYAGWYGTSPEGVFKSPKIEFMPGAFAYHLHSFSASVIRSRAQNWVGPLLDKGATITLGCVYEPYLPFTPNLPVFFSRLFQGFTFGEAALACQAGLSWQTAVIGDPLYRPFGKTAHQWHEELGRANNKLAEWSSLRQVTIAESTGASNPELDDLIRRCPQFESSAVLMEKLGSLALVSGKTNDAISDFTRALQLKPSPQQKVRLFLTVADLMEKTKEQQEALSVLKQFQKECADYPDMDAVLQRIANLGNNPAQ